LRFQNLNEIILNFKLYLH